MKTKETGGDVLSDAPLKETCGVVGWQHDFKAQGFGLYRVEIDGAGCAFVGGIMVGTSDGLPLSISCLVKDAP